MLRAVAADVSRSFTSLASPADPSGTDIQRASDFAVAYAPSQRAVRDAQPVILTWFVELNALEDRDNGRLGSFNMATLMDSARVSGAGT